MFNSLHLKISIVAIFLASAAASNKAKESPEVAQKNSVPGSANDDFLTDKQIDHLASIKHADLAPEIARFNHDLAELSGKVRDHTVSREEAAGKAQQKFEYISTDSVRLAAIDTMKGENPERNAKIYREADARIRGDLLAGKITDGDAEKQRAKEWDSYLENSKLVMLFVTTDPPDADKHWSPAALVDWKACTDPFTVVGWGNNQVRVSSPGYQPAVEVIETKQRHVAKRIVLKKTAKGNGDAGPTPKGAGPSGPEVIEVK